METTGIGLGDAMIMARQAGDNNYGNYGMWNNPFFYLIFLALFSNGGVGGWNNNNGINLGVIESAKADIIQNTQAVNDAQTLSQQIRGITNGLSSLGFSLNNSIKDTGYGLREAIGSGFAGMHNDFDKVNYNLMENRFVGQAGVGDIKNAIQNLGFVNEQNTCKITTALHAEGEATRALIAQQAVEALKGKLAETSQELQNAKFANSQMMQNQYLIDKLGGCNGCGGC